LQDINNPAWHPRAKGILKEKTERTKGGGEKIKTASAAASGCITIVGRRIRGLGRPATLSIMEIMHNTQKVGLVQRCTAPGP
jgi:hypothetical protein